MTRQHLELLDARICRLRGWHSRGDPTRDHLVLRGTDLESLAAAVRNGHCRFEQDQTSGGFEQFRAPAQSLARQRVVIRLRIVSAQRELEAVLTRCRSVTGSRV